MNEADVQNKARLLASKEGYRLWRNNVGAYMDDRGVPVRYGLANESKGLNTNLKSADLIGIRPVLITQEMVGTTIGQFFSIECKHSEWNAKTLSPRESAQDNWIKLINNLGGYAKFYKGEDEL